MLARANRDQSVPPRRNRSSCASSQPMMGRFGAALILGPGGTPSHHGLQSQNNAHLNLSEGASRFGQRTDEAAINCIKGANRVVDT
jgi:hypothetical protein